MSNPPLFMFFFPKKHLIVYIIDWLIQHVFINFKDLKKELLSKLQTFKVLSLYKFKWREDQW
jgi:hypothetical protein